MYSEEILCGTFGIDLKPGNPVSPLAKWVLTS